MLVVVVEKVVFEPICVVVVDGCTEHPLIVRQKAESWVIVVLMAVPSVVYMVLSGTVHCSAVTVVQLSVLAVLPGSEVWMLLVGSGALVDLGESVLEAPFFGPDCMHCISRHVVS